MRYRKLTSSGDYSFGHNAIDFFVDSVPGVAQRIETVLKLIQGEWFLDNTAGVPYFTEVFGYNTQSLYDGVIKQAIENIPEVISITTYSSSLNAVTRLLNISATIQTIFSTVPVTITTSVPVSGGYGVGGYGQRGYGQ